MLDYSNAPPQQDFGTIPDGTLAWAILSLRRGKEGTPETISNSGESSYLDFELTITEGPFAKRKVWEMVGTRGTEKYVNQGRSSIRSILEVGRGASAANMAGYQIAGYEQLDTLKVAIEIGVEKQQGYQDKNRVKSWLTPNTESSTHRRARGSRQLRGNRTLWRRVVRRLVGLQGSLRRRLRRRGCKGVRSEPAVWGGRRRRRGAASRRTRRRLQLQPSARRVSQSGPQTTTGVGCDIYVGRTTPCLHGGRQTCRLPAVRPLHAARASRRSAPQGGKPRGPREFHTRQLPARRRRCAAQSRGEHAHVLRHTPSRRVAS
jgi:hypothetical protein